MFHSDDLNVSYDKVAKEIKEFQASVNKISEDIQKCEQVLTERKVYLEFEYFCHSVLLSGGIHSKNYYLVWAQYSQPGSSESPFRLLLGQTLVDHQNSDAEKTESLEPLLETQVNTRLAMFAYLPMFLEALGEECKAWHSLDT